MNPGKLIDAVRVYDPVENLRYLTQSTAGRTHAHDAALAPPNARNAFRLCRR